MPPLAKLMVHVGTDTSEFNRGMDDTERRVSGFGSVVTRSLGVGAVALGAGVAAGVGVGIKAAGDLEQAVANVSTIKPEIDTSAVFSSLNQLSTKVPQTSEQLGNALYNVFSSVDVNAAEGLALVEKFAKGAVGAATDAETFGTAAMGIMNAYGLRVKDADHISDVFFNTVNAGVVSGQELASGLGPVTQSAKSAGVSLDMLGGLIAGVTKEGGPAAQNINNLNNFLQKVTTKDAQKELMALGISTTDATGKFRPVTDVLGDLRERLGGMTEAARANAMQAIFPDAQARIGAATLISQLDTVKEVMNTNMTSAGAAEAAYAKMSGTFNSQSQLLQNTMMSIVTTLGASLLPAITPMVTAFAEWLPGAVEATKVALAPLGELLMTTLVPGFQALFQALSAMVPVLVEHGPLLAGIAAGLAAFVVISTVVSWVTGLIAAIGALSGAFAAAGSVVGVIVAILGGPVTLIILAVAAVIGVLTAAWIGNWGDIQGKTQAVVSFLGSLPGTIGGFFGAIGDTVANLGTTIGATWDGITSAIGGAIDGIGSMISDGWNGFVSVITDALSSIHQAVTDVWNQIPEDIRSDLVAVVTAIGEKLGEALSAVTTWTSNVVSTLAQWVTDSVTKAAEMGAGVLTSISTKVGEALTAVGTWAGDVVGRISTLATNAGTAALNVGTAILNPIKEQVGNALTAVGTWASDLVGKVTGIVGQVTGAARSVGQGIVDGITSAIRGGLSAIMDAAAEAARSALKGAKAALGIKSPSRAFEDEVGVPSVQGMMRGWEKMATPLADTIRSVVQPPTLAPSPGSAIAGTASGRTPRDAMRVPIYIGNKMIEELWIEGRELALKHGAIRAGSAA